MSLYLEGGAEERGAVGGDEEALPPRERHEAQPAAYRGHSLVSLVEWYTAVEVHAEGPVSIPIASKDRDIYTGRTDRQKSVANPTHFFNVLLGPTSGEELVLREGAEGMLPTQKMK